jgi:hypothetical protein
MGSALFDAPMGSALFDASGFAAFDGALLPPIIRAAISLALGFFLAGFLGIFERRV